VTKPKRSRPIVEWWVEIHWLKAGWRMFGAPYPRKADAKRFARKMVRGYRISPPAHFRIVRVTYDRHEGVFRR
jgi:hypothetical protein